MSTATTPAAPPRSSAPILAGLIEYVAPNERLLLTGVRYADYVRLTDWCDAERRRAVRLTFDRGKLEITVVGNIHERFKKVVALLIEAWIEETGGDYAPSGEFTHLRADLEVGLQSDECYYIQNAPRVYGLRDIDLSKDPPPDLAVEAEVSNPVLDKLRVYAAFGVPEVWRYDGRRLAVLLLQPDGTYRESPTSRALPTLPLAELPRFLALAASVDIGYATIARQFRAWVRSLPPAPNA
jgi:Uma2 family endonuclease